MLGRSLEAMRFLVESLRRPQAAELKLPLLAIEISSRQILQLNESAEHQVERPAASSPY